MSDKTAMKEAMMILSMILLILAAGGGTYAVLTGAHGEDIFDSPKHETICYEDDVSVYAEYHDAEPSDEILDECDGEIRTYTLT